MALKYPPLALALWVSELIAMVQLGKDEHTNRGEDK